MRHVALPSAGLYPIRVLAAAGMIYGVTAVLHGSGFLAVFVAGILIGDERAPYKHEIEHFHSVLAHLGEIVAFTVLGLTIDLETFTEQNTWQIGLALAVILGLVVRPLLVGLMLLPLDLRPNERLFVMWAGLKGAVPILLGTFILTADVDDSVLLYDYVIVGVAFSVIVQGGLVPSMAGWLKLPVRVIEPEPWTIGLRFRDEPEGLHRYVVAPRSPSDGLTVSELDLGEDGWVSLVLRSGRMLHVGGDLRLEAGDEALLLAPADMAGHLAAIFTAAGSTPPP
jgi:cell volume regulation protein A